MMGRTRNIARQEIGIKEIKFVLRNPAQTTVVAYFNLIASCLLYFNRHFAYAASVNGTCEIKPYCNLCSNCLSGATCRDCCRP
jgi:hypothetical protein